MNWLPSVVHASSAIESGAPRIDCLALFVYPPPSNLIWLNLLFLLATVLMPFSTGYYSEYVGRGVVSPVIFYTANICLLGLSNFLMWRYLSNPKNNLTENLTPPLAKYFSLRALTVPTIFCHFLICLFVQSINCCMDYHKYTNHLTAHIQPHEEKIIITSEN